MSEYLKRVNKIREGEDKEQQTVFDDDISFVVTAGPGSGKTFLLTTKAAKLLHSQSVKSPQLVACLTYSRFLENQLRNELQRVGILHDERIFVGTVHSFCISQVIIPFKQLLNLQIPVPFRIASWDEMLYSLRHALGRQKLSIQYDKDLKDLMRDLNKYRKLHIGQMVETFSERNEYARRHLTSLNWFKLAQDYVDILQNGSGKLSSIDFVEIEIISLRAIEENPIVRKCLAARFPWWLVDEYQDLGYPFHRIMISMLTNTKINLVAIGDKDQCIYEEIQGSKPFFIDDLAKILHQSKTKSKSVTLRNNYRCIQPIINLSEIMLGESRGYKSGVDFKGGCYSVHFQWVNQQQALLYRILKYLTQSQKGPKLSNSQIAILAPTRSLIKYISDDLNNHGWINSPDKDPDYNRDLDLIKWFELLAKWCLKGLDEQPYFIDLLPKWFELHEVQIDDNNFKLEKQLFDVLWDLRKIQKSLLEWFRALHKKLNLDSLIKNYGCTRPDEALEYTNLIAQLKNKSRISTWSLEQFARTENSITLTTIYSSKGSQFEAIIIAAFNRLVYHKRAHNPIPLDRRLAYVGVTRARRFIYLLANDDKAFFVQKLLEAKPKGTIFYLYNGSNVRKRHFR